MRIEFVIDELVLTGFDPRDRHRIADAIQRGMEAHATSANMLPLVHGDRDVPVVRGGDVSPARGAPATAVADAVGGAIVGGLAAHGVGRTV